MLKHKVSNMHYIMAHIYTYTALYVFTEYNMH